VGEVAFDRLCGITPLQGRGHFSESRDASGAGPAEARMCPLTTRCV
jgi:hypothetical protein